MNREQELDKANLGLAMESHNLQNTLNLLISWADSVLNEPDFIECRRDEDCDHCLGKQVVEQARTLLKGLST